MRRTPLFAALLLLVVAPWPSAVVAGGSLPTAITNVSGSVYDSIGRAPLAGALVQLVGVMDSVAGRVYQTRSDSAGRYLLADVPPGAYSIGFAHVKLDSLGIELSTRAVEVRGGAQRIELATPSAATIARAVCPEGTYGDSVGVLLGRILSARDRLPLPGAAITATWTETVIERNNIRQRDPEVAAAADSAGWFGMCALPAEVPLMVRAGLGEDSTGYVVVEMRPGEVRAAVFTIGEAVRTALVAADTGIGASPSDSAIIWQWRGAARLTGTVRDDREQPVAGARVGIWSSGRHAVTSDRGVFSIDSAPGGTHTLEVRALGYVPVQRAVHLSPDTEEAVTVALGEKTTALPTVTVRGRLVYSRNLTKFEERRRSSPFGQFFTPEKLENLGAMRLSSVMMQVSGVIVSSSAPGRPPQILMKRGGGLCAPSFYVDGIRTFMNTEEIDLWFRSDDLAGIEVYPRTSLVPNEYAGLLTGCGVIAVWTRPPGVKLKK